MSWDVVLFRAPAGTVSFGELPRDYRPDPIGSHADVERSLRAGLPMVDLSDPTWGTLDGSTWSIELNIGRDDPVESVMLHVRGTGDDVLPYVFQIAHALGCTAFDCSDGSALTEGDTEGWQTWQAYRGRAL